MLIWVGKVNCVVAAVCRNQISCNLEGTVIQVFFSSPSLDFHRILFIFPRNLIFLEACVLLFSAVYIQPELPVDWQRDGAEGSPK